MNLKPRSNSMSSSSSVASSSSSESGSDVEDVEEPHQEPDTNQAANASTSDQTKSPKASKLQWNATTTQQLVKGILSQVNGVDQLPFEEFQVDWDSLELPFPLDNCKRKWTSLLSRVRHYRTITEIGTEILLRHEACDKAALDWNKKLQEDRFVKTGPQLPKPKPKAKTKSTYPAKYPKRPKSAYNLFTAEMSAKLRSEGVVSQGWFSRISQEWKQMDARQRTRYLEDADKIKEKYLAECMDYAKKNPDDEAILLIIQKEKERNHNNRLPGVSSSDSDVNKNHSITEYLVPNNKPVDAVPDSDNSNEDDTLNDTALASFQDTPSSPKKSKHDARSSSPEKSPQKKKHSEGATNSSPEKSKKRKSKEEDSSFTQEKSKKRKSKEEDSSFTQVKSPKKKKKMQLIRATGEDMFVEAKKETYQLSHPDMSDDAVEEKLKSKFAKLNQKKQDKWNTLAEEKNENA